MRLPYLHTYLKYSELAVKVHFYLRKTRPQRSRLTLCPDTSTARMPVGGASGRSEVVLSATVAGSKSSRSAGVPSVPWPTPAR